MTSTLREEARALLPAAVDLRRRIHRRPELGLDLPETQATVLEALAGLDLDVRTGEKISSVVADLHGRAGEGPTLALRADMDALPMPEDTGLDFRSEVEGAMHACGHDAHTAMLLAAVRLLHDRRDTFGGHVRFLFQPGEEGSGGAALMIEEGALDGVDAAFAIHVTPNVPTGMVTTRPGPLLASVDDFEITVRGRGGHASTPHFGNDPVPVACEIVQAFHTFVTRRVDVFDPAVVTVGSIRGGTTKNVVPETVDVEGTMRTVSRPTRQKVQEGLERIARHVAAAHDMDLEWLLIPSYPVTVNDAAFAGFVLDVAGRLVGEGAAFEMPFPVMGAEDFSYVLERTTGAMAFLGVCPEGVNPAEAPSCHSNRMMLAEDAMATGIALHASVALDYLAGGFTG